jgi:hypothetical protein
MNSGARVWHLRLRINRLLPMRLIRRNLSMRMRACRARPVNHYNVSLTHARQRRPPSAPVRPGESALRRPGHAQVTPWSRPGRAQVRAGYR